MSNGKRSMNPVMLYAAYEPLRCKVCERDLLEDFHAVVAFARSDRQDKQSTEVVYWACKGNCDAKLEDYYRKEGLRTGWEEIEDLTNPQKFLSWNMAILNRIRNNKDIYSDEAFEDLKQFIITMAQFVFREPTVKEKERYALLQTLPEGM